MPGTRGLLLPMIAVATVLAPAVAAAAAQQRDPIELYFLRPDVEFVEPPTSRTAGGFTIHLRFGLGLTESQKAVFSEAKAAWEARISGYQPGINLSSITIRALARPIDGVSGILGQAGPLWITIQGGYILPTWGFMMFDSADLDVLESAGLLRDVIEHEMGHILGIGVMWWFNGLYRFFTFQYIGEEGLAAWQTNFSGQSTATGVPVEDEGGLGTAAAHWNENEGGAGLVGISDTDGNDMRDELMTGWLNPNVFYSILTHEHLKDLGYTVHPYSPPLFRDGFESSDLESWSLRIP